MSKIHNKIVGIFCMLSLLLFIYWSLSKPTFYSLLEIADVMLEIDTSEYAVVNGVVFTSDVLRLNSKTFICIDELGSNLGIAFSLSNAEATLTIHNAQEYSPVLIDLVSEICLNSDMNGAYISIELLGKDVVAELAPSVSLKSHSREELIAFMSSRSPIPFPDAYERNENYYIYCLKPAIRYSLGAQLLTFEQHKTQQFMELIELGGHYFVSLPLELEAMYVQLEIRKANTP